MDHITIGGRTFKVEPPDPYRNDIVLTDAEDVASVTTQRYSASDEDVLISDPGKERTATTRRVLRYEIVPNNLRDASATVKVDLLHQRRGSRSIPAGIDWKDAEPFDLRTLGAHQEVRMPLSCGETKRLYQELTRLYRASGGYQPEPFDSDPPVVNGDDVTILRGREKQIIEQLLEQEGEAFWDHVEALQPNLLEAVAVKKQHQARRLSLQTFESEMDWDIWDESEWERFFRDNTWIFGYGLSYQFLSTVQNQPHYGGTTVSGRGAQRGDSLMATEAAARVTVLVDIKKPSSPLLAQTPYRGASVYRVATEVSGGIAQLQANCFTWATQGSQHPANRIDFEQRGIHTYEPKGILVVGSTSQFEGDSSKMASFALFRRNLHNPEIITFDELLERARYIIELDTLHERVEPSDVQGDEA